MEIVEKENEGEENQYGKMKEILSLLLVIRSFCGMISVNLNGTINWLIVNTLI
ncbi:MAG: hypothetical protein V1862_11675 [Methanobacteriota archaeon]